MKLKIKPARGADGTIHGESFCVGSTESDPSNNTASIVFGAPAGDPSGGGVGGGGLAVTGTPVTLIAGVGGTVAILGLASTIAFRRWRLILQAPLVLPGMTTTPVTWRSGC